LSVVIDLFFLQCVQLVEAGVQQLSSYSPGLGHEWLYNNWPDHLRKWRVKQALKNCVGREGVWGGRS